jgi:CcmD family protein
MTPNTTIYMVAGFTVILLGVFFYLLSLVLRIRNLNQKIKKY